VLVVNASYAVRACGVAQGFAILHDDDLFAPPLMWAEVRSALHEGFWRSEVGSEDAEEALRRLDEAPVRMRNPKALSREAWRLATELGWAKTYDAEYLALARLLGCRVVTVDSHLRRGVERLALAVLPTEL
jgi:predicted nucleic acid-binding protein